MPDSPTLNSKVTDNLQRIRIWLLAPPLLGLMLICLYLFQASDGSGFTGSYVALQKHVFIRLNATLSAFPGFQYNLTQLGDGLILFALFSVFIVLVPRLWEALLTAGLISIVVSATLKQILYVPRPAAMYDRGSFVIIGTPLTGNSSLPSGHAMTVFLAIGIFLFAFMPKRGAYKILWSVCLLTLGLIVAFTRVGVGAHYPFDVIIGSIIGFMIAIAGIKTSNALGWWTRINTRFSYPVLAFILSIWIYVLIRRIADDHLLIYYLPLLSLATTLYLLANAYVKKH